ncbi:MULTISPECIES: serine/threonine-protein kinase [Kitasatospora]|uniref:non-specific serine/threonine protein kinase n=1 Tax=Kitasatospora setae (strain ATCC 33774 / DSM 43861 / JCM 3304 / KCC A-0304 / NBRC 14216 / KM-6054) TaxID=452652 RepID=E4N5Y8_KITSK|nr:MULTISPECIES: serine/threonine-protein kinase [Kitasatospora]BAJ26619.1 putative serine/threonine protein kinase [Kitasatospora setae KM-6054]
MSVTAESIHGTALFADRYRVEGTLGRGSAAEVLRAVDLRLGREVALKVLRCGAPEDFARRFTAEARTLARLRHPGVVEVYDHGSADDRPYLVLELVDGPTLADVLRTSPLSVSATLRLGRELAGTLAFVHEQGVVHRDVKPSNVLIDASGSPRLTDFGIARHPLDECTQDAEATRTGFVVGTPAYLAPEQVRGEGARPPVDVYALGLLLIECLTGQRAYPGGPMEATLARLLHSPAIPPGAPAPLARALRAMTRTDPAARPSAAACADLLDPRTPEPPASRSEAPAGRSVARRKRVALSAGTVGLLLAAGAGSMAFGTERPAAPPAPRPAVTSTPAPAPTPSAPPAAPPAAAPVQAPVQAPSASAAGGSAPARSVPQDTAGPGSGPAEAPRAGDGKKKGERGEKDGRTPGKGPKR